MMPAESSAVHPAGEPADPDGRRRQHARGANPVVGVRRHSQANFTAKSSATATSVGEHSCRRPAITLIST